MFPTAPTPPTLSLPTGIPAVARTGMRLLQQIRHGSLLLELPDGSQHRYGTNDTPFARMRLNNWNVFSEVMHSGDIGLAESYMDEDWTTPHLADLLRLLIANRNELESLVYGSWWGRLINRVRHLLHRNTKANSRKNIHAHYDLGNSFYELWLDPSMNYSSAWFHGNLDGDLTQAQNAKVRRALRCVGLQPKQRLLEIGCGWGALAEMASTEFNANVVGVTLSTEQLAYGKQRMLRAGVENHVDLRLQDYRDIDDGPYDAICSIEMIEAVGREYWGTYFKKIHQLLKPGGAACIQAIVIDDALFDRYIEGSDFIQQYIFPGGCLPCPRVIHEEAANVGMYVQESFSFGKDYAETLRRWHQSFIKHKNVVIAEGFDEQFIKTWKFYLAYCEAAFDMGNINVVQYTLRKDNLS